MSAVRYPKPAQLATLGRTHAVVEASAGTGKTYLLEHLVVDLLLRAGAELDQILVVTFTEKATAELVHRIRAKLEELVSLTEDSPSAHGLPDDRCWIIDRTARERLRAALFGFDRANVFTIHGFCQRVLAEHAFASGRMFAEETVDDAEAFHDAFLETLRRDLVNDEAAATVVTAWRRAGRSLERLERNVLEAHRKLASLYPSRPDALVPRFTLDEAAIRRAVAGWPALDPDDGRLREALRLGGLDGRKSPGLIKACREAAAVLAAPSLGELLVAADAFDQARREKRIRGFEDVAARASHGTGPLPRSIAAAAAALRDAIPPLEAVAVATLLPLVAARFAARKQAAGQLDFQDMLTLLARAIEDDGPRGRAIVDGLRARYRFALVDEFQDTDEVQWSIFRRLFVEGDGHVLTLVGDPKQAIYGFRGADVATYLRARDEVHARGGTSLPLDVNFRSSARLIDAYNAILDQGAEAPFFRADGPIRYEHPVSCGRPELRLVDANGQDAAPVRVLSVEPAHPHVDKLRLWEIKPALLARLAREIVELTAPGDGGLRLAQGASSRRLRAGDVFVLTRTTRESREVGEALRAAGVPFAFFKQEKLFDTVEAREVLDVLRAIAEPSDRAARARALVTSFFGLTLPELASCDDLPADHPIAARLAEWTALAEAGAIEPLFARMLDASGVVCRELFAGAGERRLTNVLHLFELLQAEATRTHASLRELVGRLGAWIAGTQRPDGRETDVQRLETDADAVQIMTIHHSKGLEAPVVFVYGGLWPWFGTGVRAYHDQDGRRVVRVGRGSSDDEARIKEENDDEERRVLYVALTRARARLCLPLYPASDLFKLRGAYKLVDDRLRALMDGPRAGTLFERVPISCPVAPPDRAIEADVADALARFEPPVELLRDDKVDSSFAQIADTRAGFLVTSYSAVKRQHGGFVPAGAGDDPAADEAQATGVGSDDAATELPRGRLTGTFLHELLEHAPLEGIAGTTVEAWSTKPEIAALLERMRRRHDRAPEHMPLAAALVHTALSAPMRLGAHLVPALASADRVVREMEFLFPIPARAHPLLAGAVGKADEHRPFAIERGVVKGFMDVIFTHGDRTFVLDWKGDALAAWDPATVEAHARRNYDVQARLYTLAALRVLGVTDDASYEARFGGVAFAFLRGRRPGDPDAGLVFHRPTFAEVLDWERALLLPAFWGTT